MFPTLVRVGQLDANCWQEAAHGIGTSAKRELRDLMGLAARRDAALDYFWSGSNILPSGPVVPPLLAVIPAGVDAGSVRLLPIPSRGLDALDSIGFATEGHSEQPVAIYELLDIDGFGLRSAIDLMCVTEAAFGPAQVIEPRSETEQTLLEIHDLYESHTFVGDAGDAGDDNSDSTPPESSGSQEQVGAARSSSWPAPGLARLREVAEQLWEAVERRDLLTAAAAHFRLVGANERAQVDRVSRTQLADSEAEVIAGLLAEWDGLAPEIEEMIGEGAVEELRTWLAIDWLAFGGQRLVPLLVGAALPAWVASSSEASGEARAAATLSSDARAVLAFANGFGVERTSSWERVELGCLLPVVRYEAAMDELFEAELVRAVRAVDELRSDEIRPVLRAHGIDPSGTQAEMRALAAAEISDDLVAAWIRANRHGSTTALDGWLIGFTDRSDRFVALKEWSQQFAPDGRHLEASRWLSAQRRSREGEAGLEHWVAWRAQMVGSRSPDAADRGGLAAWGVAPTPVLPAWMRAAFGAVTLPPELRDGDSDVTQVSQLDSQFWADRSPVLDETERQAVHRLAVELVDADAGDSEASIAPGGWHLRVPFQTEVVPQAAPATWLDDLPLLLKTREALASRPWMVSYQSLTIGDLVESGHFGMPELLDLMCVVEAALGIAGEVAPRNRAEHKLAAQRTAYLLSTEPGSLPQDQLVLTDFIVKLSRGEKTRILRAMAKLSEAEAVGEVLAERDQRIGEMFVFMSALRGPPPVDDLDRRSGNCLLRRMPDLTWESIAALRPADILSIPNAGQATVRRVIAWTYRQSQLAANAGANPDPNFEIPDSPPTVDVGDNTSGLGSSAVGALGAALVDALLPALALARDATECRTVADVLESPRLGELLDSAGSLRALGEIGLDELPAEAGAAAGLIDAVRHVEHLRGPLDADIFVRHKVHGTDTLNVLGEERGVTRERIRQLERRFADSLNESAGHPAETIASMLRSELPPIAPVRAIDNLIDPVLVAAASSLREELSDTTRDIARHLVKTRLKLTTKGELALSEEGVAAVDRLGELVSDVVDDVGIVDLEGLVGRTAPETLPMLDDIVELLGLVRVGAHVALRDSLRVRVKLALLEIGRPATKEEITEQGALHSQRVGSTLSNIESVARADRTRWGLLEWIDDIYEGIPAEIQQRIDERGGAVPLSFLLEDIPERFGVTEASVRSYVATRQFDVTDGMVSLASTTNIAYRSLDDVADRNEHGELSWEFPVEARYFEGFSIIGFPPELARELGCGPNDRCEVPVASPEGCEPVSVIWRLTSVSGAAEVGRSRAALDALATQAGRRARLVIAADRASVRFEHADSHPPSADGSSGDDILERLKNRRRID